MGAKQVQITIRVDQELYDLVKEKCKDTLGIGISPLIKVFLKSFVTQRGVGFYVGDEDFCHLFNRWLGKKEMERYRKGCAPLPGPRLKDLYDLSKITSQAQIHPRQS
jgi:hypothetical protein